MKTRVEVAVTSTGVARFTMTNPATLNAVDGPMREALTSAFTKAAVDRGVRVIVLTGEGNRSFCSGADIGEFKTLPLERFGDILKADMRLIEAVRACPKPVIARINGYALGTGLLLALACDLLVAREDAELGLPEIRRGTAVGLQAALLPHFVGRALARRMALLGERIEAREGAACGLVTFATRPEDLDTKVDSVANKLAGLDPIALATQKRILRLWEEETLARAIDASVPLVEALVMLPTSIGGGRRCKFNTMKVGRV